MATMQEIIKKYNLENLGGNDNFINDKFDAREWSAPIIQEPQVLKEYLDASGIVGSTIKEIAVVEDLFFGFTNLWCSALYYEFNLENNKQDLPAEYDKTIEWLKKNNIKIATSDIDKPIVFLTDKGKFEIDTSESSSVRISKNTLPSIMYASSNNNKISFDIRKIFSCLTGSKIVNFCIEEQDYWDAEDTFTGSFGITLKANQLSYIKSFKLILDNGLSLLFSNDYDWQYLALLDNSDNIITVPGLEIEKFLKTPIKNFKY